MIGSVGPVTVPSNAFDGDVMPTTFGFLFRVLILAALASVAIYLLANFVEPTPEPVSIRVSTDRFE